MWYMEKKCHFSTKMQKKVRKCLYVWKKNSNFALVKLKRRAPAFGLTVTFDFVRAKVCPRFQIIVKQKS